MHVCKDLSNMQHALPSILAVLSVRDIKIYTKCDEIMQMKQILIG